ncbi:MAG: signal peptidase I [Clostridia bacterium]|nr:signal peptidase I [Clostridia bacterium]
MGRVIKKIWNLINTLLIGVVLVLAIALAGVRVFGIDLYVVLSSSMEPEYMTGSVIYVKDVDTSTLDVGDDITFRMSGDTVATHRIIEVTQQDGQTAYRTQGIANDMPDANLVLESQVVGSPIFTVPQLGYFVEYLHSTSGIYATVTIGIVLLLMVILPDVIFGSDDKKDKKKAKESK